jgi:hypothetical protein
MSVSARRRWSGIEVLFKQSAAGSFGYGEKVQLRVHRILV